MDDQVVSLSIGGVIVRYAGTSSRTTYVAIIVACLAGPTAKAQEAVVMGWARQDFEPKMNQMRAEGWWLHVVNAYDLRGQELINAVWRK
jgi:hypothetical protein